MALKNLKSTLVHLLKKQKHLNRVSHDDSAYNTADELDEMPEHLGLDMMMLDEMGNSTSDVSIMGHTWKQAGKIKGYRQIGHKIKFNSVERDSTFKKRDSSLCSEDSLHMEAPTRKGSSIASVSTEKRSSSSDTSMGKNATEVRPRRQRRSRSTNYVVNQEGDSGITGRSNMASSDESLERIIPKEDIIVGSLPAALTENVSDSVPVLKKIKVFAEKSYLLQMGCSTPSEMTTHKTYEVNFSGSFPKDNTTQFLVQYGPHDPTSDVDVKICMMEPDTPEDSDEPCPEQPPTEEPPLEERPIDMTDGRNEEETDREEKLDRSVEETDSDEMCDETQGELKKFQYRLVHLQEKIIAVHEDDIKELEKQGDKIDIWTIGQRNNNHTIRVPGSEVRDTEYLACNFAAQPFLMKLGEYDGFLCNPFTLFTLADACVF